MGFSAPKPDPKITQQQEAQAAQARANKVSLIQDQLSNEDQIRARLYGSRGASLFKPMGAGKQAMQGLPSLFGTGFGGTL